MAPTSNTRMFLLPNDGSNQHGSTTDTLAQVLLDPRFPTKGIENHEEWNIELKKLNMGKKNSSRYYVLKTMKSVNFIYKKSQRAIYHKLLNY